MTSIVLPTIIFCIGMVAAMLVGINKCKQWELDKVVEMRRTRRVLQRVTNRLREKNFKTIQKARTMRKRATKTRSSQFSPPAYVSQVSNEIPRSVPVPESPRRYARSRPNATRRLSRQSNKSTRKQSIQIV
ncbi:unnamed protein product [Caenorhabditis bovis]|uniref:Uncharacterized protein n=1 Tax=Caenorhabditis bovis TaxID=2654633 RepID=A0A8S1E2L0_9PELO|nr:unnamed protein product [Caenorhabditis bovis]